MYIDWDYNVNENENTFFKLISLKPNTKILERFYMGIN